MIGYFDTSAIVPLFISEPSSGFCEQQWAACDVRISSVLVIAETHAALAQALRLGRLTAAEHESALKLFKVKLEELSLISVTRELAESAGQLAFTYALRGYDAMHAAGILALRADSPVLFAGDADLLAAVSAMGFGVVDINAVPTE